MDKQTEQTNQARKYKPATAPYISVAKLEDVINLVSNRNYSEFTTDIFENRGFSTADARLAINTLRFLKLITDEGKPTEQIKKIGLEGDVRKEAFKEIIQNAYKKLFDVVDEPQNLSSMELRNEMRTQYNLSNRIARQAVPVFLKLAEFAGLVEEGIVVSRKRKTKSNKEKVKKRKTETQSSQYNASKSESKSISSASGNMILSGDIGITLSEDIQRKMLFDEKLYKEIQELIKTAKSINDEFNKGEESVDNKEDSESSS